MSTTAKQSGKRELTAVDLFSGCGGLTEGLKEAGFRVVAAVENNRLAFDTYKANHVRGLPENERVRCAWLEDIRSVRPQGLMRALGIVPGELDLLAGCPPCEGFSRLRTKNGARYHEEDENKNDLVFAYLKFVEAMLPKAVMMENVPALKKDERMQRVLRKLKNLGYAVDLDDPDETVDVLDAADYGVPQRRRRMILMTGRGFSIPFAPKAEERDNTVRETFGRVEEHVRKRKDDWLHYHGERRSEKVKKIMRSVEHDGGSYDRSLPCHRKSDGFNDVYGRMKWGDVAPTITSGCTNPSKGRFLHPEKDRAITLREAAALQSFPLDYSFKRRRGKSGVASMIGDALPPEFVRRHALEAAKCIERERGRLEREQVEATVGMIAASLARRGRAGT